MFAPLGKEPGCGTTQWGALGTQQKGCGDTKGAAMKHTGLGCRECQSLEGVAWQQGPQQPEVWAGG